jgi:diaminopimelate epimerase
MAWRAFPFSKAHGLGNDFLIVQSSDLQGIETGEIARRLCDRHMSVGADGIVVLGKSQVAEASVRIYNSDGSEATLSGNALRCAATWLRKADAGQAVANAVVQLETKRGVRELRLLAQQGKRCTFCAEMGQPSFRAAEVPFRPPQPAREPIVELPLPVGDSTVVATILHMGNPQCIVFVENWESTDWRSLGQELERHPWFPDRANVGFVRVAGRDRLEARFWERGAGHTLASGTGSCASAVAAHLAKGAPRRVMVEVERGEMEVHWRADGMVELTGPAEIVAEGTAYLEMP